MSRVDPLRTATVRGDPMGGLLGHAVDDLLADELHDIAGQRLTRRITDLRGDDSPNLPFEDERALGLQVINEVLAEWRSAAYGDGLKDEQEVLAQIADVITEAYAAESAIARAEKMASRGDGRAARVSCDRRGCRPSRSAGPDRHGACPGRWPQSRIGAVLGAQTSGGRVLQVTQIDPRRSSVRVRGLASSGVSNGYGPYGVGAYGAAGYGYAPDLSFRCDVDYRGYITNVDINRRR